MSLPRHFDRAAFLRDTWQRHPVLIRNAFPELDPPLAIEEVAGLACEDGVEARLVLEKHGATPWEVRHGPFDEDDFAALPASHWTLLVQDVDKWIPAAAAWLEPFRFVPDWRIDDLMISIAADQGSVGPHWDDYDVFLIQGAGRREWRIDDRAVCADNHLDGIALRIMRDFQTRQSWVLEPGDMLYLPPRLAHHGIALGDGCMTLSVGFRAPDQVSLIEDFVTEHVVGAQADRFRDPPRAPDQNPGLIDAASLAGLRALLESGLQLDADRFNAWIGAYLTRAKPGISALPREAARQLTPDGLDAELRRHPHWARDGAARLAFIPADGGDTRSHYGFINGEAVALDDSALHLLEHLCAHTRYAARDLRTLTASLHARALLTRLINEGLIHDVE